jgi:hypothetical protein
VFEISFPASVHSGSVTGRIFLLISRTNEPDKQFLSDSTDAPVTFGVEADHLMPGQSAHVDGRTLGSPVNLEEIPSGDFYIQAYAKVYAEYHRSDGHHIWGLDQWDGQEFAHSPGNLYSKIQKVHFDPSRDSKVKLTLTEVVPPEKPPVDTECVKHIKIESKLLSHFWGRPIYLGAEIVLPRDYSSHPDLKYPVIYDPRNHYLRSGPFDFTTDNIPESQDDRRKRAALGYETGYEFYQAWNANHFPRMIAATLIDPTPYYDFSAAMNSVNNGPYDDAIMTELIPYIEDHFRIIREPYARVLVGKSSGARDALGLQLHHPDFFGAAWLFYPWAFDYRRYFVFNIYEAENAFELHWSETQGFHTQNEWSLPLERVFVRTTDGQPVYTMRSWVRAEAVAGGHSGVGAELTGSDDALNGPIGEDGYPKPLYDKLTGKIDHNVANYWREHDLAYYAEKNWPKIGPLLVGKLHFYIGDMDEWHRNFGVHDFEDFLKSTKEPYYGGSFVYGSLKGHGWQPMTNADLVRMIGDCIIKNATKGAGNAWRDE